jgi:hypothetical protein
MSNPYVFIVGCPRSGTTLLQRIVNAHPQIAVMPESHWIPRLRRQAKGGVTRELISSLLEQREFPALHLGQEEVQPLIGNGEPVSYSCFISRLFDLYGRNQGKTLVGNKTPGFVRRLKTIHALWPAARIVHLIRDGRDVFLSVSNRPLKHPDRAFFATWNEDPVSTGALRWEVNVRKGRRAGQWLGPDLYYEMRYESLVNRPAEECAALCRFLGVPDDEAMLRFYERQTTRKAARPITPGLRDWRSQMRTDEVEQFEAAVGGLLDELGYARAFQRPRPEAVEKASRIRSVLGQYPVWSGHFGG